MLFVSIAAIVTAALPFAAAHPTASCFDTYDLKLVLDDCEFDNPDHNLAFITLTDGHVTNNLGEQLAFADDSVSYLSWQTPTTKLAQLKMGSFSVCEDDKKTPILNYTPYSTGAPQPLTDTFKICTDIDGTRGVYLGTATTDLPCEVLTFPLKEYQGKKAATGPAASQAYKAFIGKCPCIDDKDKKQEHQQQKDQGNKHHNYGSRYTKRNFDGGLAQNFPSTPSAHVKRASDAKASQLTIGTMFRNKSKYLVEWIEFYRMLGVDSFLLYDHGSTDAPLDVLQPYLDSGLVSYIQWPPQSIADVAKPLPSMSARDLTAQNSFLAKTLEACVKGEWQTHKQGACQFAASVDMLRRTTGQTEWLGFLDIDEFVYPTRASGVSSLATIFSQEAPFVHAEYISIAGSNFGTNGHLQTPQKAASDLYEPLVIQNYLKRRAIANERESPFAAGREAFLSKSTVSGSYAQSFDLPETFARKAFVRPELALYSVVHDWVPLATRSAPLKTVELWLTYPLIKMNHYAYLSAEDADAKAVANGNPMSAYDPEQDAFYSAEKDEEILWLLPELRERLVSRL